MRSTWAPAPVSSPNTLVSSTSAASNEANDASTTRFTAAIEPAGMAARWRATASTSLASDPPCEHAVEPSDAERLVGADVTPREDDLQPATPAEEVRSRAVPPAPGRIPIATSGCPSTARSLP